MLLLNPHKRLQHLLANPPLEVGDVDAVSGGLATITLIGGGTVNARGSATVGQRVYVRGGVIEGVAPSLTLVSIDV